MPSITLRASPRTVLGKQVKQLRRAGLVPGTIQGHQISPQTIQIPVKDVERLARQAGSSTLVELHVEGEPRGRNVVVRHVSHDVLSGVPTHVDLYQVRMDEPLVAEVPIHVAGESPAVRAEGGIVLSQATHVRVRALPGDMPAEIAVDASRLAHVDDAIHVRDLHLPAGVEMLTDPDELLIKVNAPRIAAEIAEEEAAASEAAAATAEAAPEAGEAPVQGEGEREGESTSTG